MDEIPQQDGTGTDGGGDNNNFRHPKRNPTEAAAGAVDSRVGTGVGVESWMVLSLWGS